MGLLPGIGVVNPYSSAESEESLIFPVSPIQKEIPLFLKFTCTEYSQDNLSRSGSTSILGVGSVKAQIAVPCPSKLVSQTSMRYKQEENINIMPDGNKNLQDTIDKLRRKIETEVMDRAAQSDAFATALGALNLLGGSKVLTQFNQLIESDFNETILQSGSKRSFIINLYLPCLNQADSSAASRIAAAFEALSLPTIAGAAVPGAVTGISLFFHPPIWFFGIGPLNGQETDIAWTSQPQASVLTNVAVTRTAIDASSFTALDGNIKPVAYSINLNFQEIEAALRVPSSGGTIGTTKTTFKILNRSAASLAATPGAGNAVTPGGQP